MSGDRVIILEFQPLVINLRAVQVAGVHADQPILGVPDVFPGPVGGRTVRGGLAAPSQIPIIVAAQVLRRLVLLIARCRVAVAVQVWRNASMGSRRAALAAG